MLAFVALAVLVHLGFALRLPESDGAESGGLGGESIISIAPASAAIAKMVEAFDRPPDTADAVSPPDGPTPETDAPEATSRPDTSITRSETEAPVPSAPAPLPDVDRASPETPVEAPSITARIAPGAAPTLPAPTASPTSPSRTPSRPELPRPPVAAAMPAPEADTRPDADTAPAEVAKLDTEGRPRVSRRPAVRPPELEARAEPDPPAPQPQTQKPRDGAAQAIDAQTSAGSGGSTSAGASGASTAKTLSQAQVSSLKARWGGQIRARVERQKRFPRGQRGRGQVVLRLTVTRDGRIAGAAIARSSGNAAYDKAAMAAVSRAGRLPAAPAGLTDATYSFNLPMDFG